MCPHPLTIWVVEFSSLINNSSTHIIEGCGHMIMIEKAFEMRDKVLEFLKK